MGGLGNQLFEIFSLIGYAFKHKDSVIFTYTPMVDKRPTYWETFLSALKPFTTFNSKYNLTNEQLNAIPMVGWTQHHYMELPQYPKLQITRLLGYFQSYKYFDEYRDTIFRMIRLSNMQSDIRNEYFTYFSSASSDMPTISMHFRYGDYVQLQQYHNLLPYQYYLNSLKHMVAVYGPKIRVLYFCEKNDNATIFGFIQRLQESYPDIVFVKVDDAIVDWKQMLIMSCCDSHIIANSTYSWWGAYFNTSEKKQVCYPSKWFGPANAGNKVNDMFLPSWTRIDI